MYCSTLKCICSTNFKGVTALFVFREEYDGNCGACGRYGHKETHSDHLAIWENLQFF
jgi:hypothetical protein